MPINEVICSGSIDRIGLETSNVIYKTTSHFHEEIVPIDSHKTGLEKVSNLLLDPVNGVIKSTSEIVAVGHRIVHGGSYFSDPTIINDDVKQKISELSELAPLHNPAHVVGIEVAQEIFITATQVAVFDTAFHQTIPEKAYKYAIPNYLLTEKKVRVYGFHGTSHKYVSEQAVDHLEVSSKIITIHLGNGCSMTAIQDGKSIDHTMGFSPSNGLIMGTRCGDIDQAVIFYMINNLGYSADEVSSILLKQSGMLGLTGFSDLREIQDEAEKGNKECQLALLMNAYRIKKTIGSYTAAMNGLDAIIFTAGIGENSAHIRKLVCEDMSYFGLALDQEKNLLRSRSTREISTEDSKVKILVIPTDEEFEIANQVYHLLKN